MQFVNEIYKNLTSTAMSAGIILVLYLVADVLFARRVQGKLKKRRFRGRLLYVGFFVFIFMMARIWVDGFTHLLAVLGLVSAALVVTNKETIMNFVGWLVINWRGLFSEDDLIQIMQYKGYVKSFGVLYFSLLEVDDFNGKITGRTVRIPNGLISNNALVNLSQTSGLLAQALSITIAPEKNLVDKLGSIGCVVNEVLAGFYAGHKDFSADHLSSIHKHLRSRLDLEARVYILPKQDNLNCLELSICYYCFAKDSEQLRQLVWLALVESGFLA